MPGSEHTPTSFSRAAWEAAGRPEIVVRARGRWFAYHAPDGWVTADGDLVSTELVAAQFEPTDATAPASVTRVYCNACSLDLGVATEGEVAIDLASDHSQECHKDRTALLLDYTFTDEPVGEE
jgi:hypothetical protein